MARSLMSGPLVVEFTGLPGVGKSHVAHLVFERLAAEDTDVASSSLRLNHGCAPIERVIRKVGLAAAQFARDPGLAWRLTHAMLGTGQPSRLEAIGLCGEWLALETTVRRARSRPRVEILDEGMSQLLWSIGLAGREGAVPGFVSAFLGGRGRPTATPDVLILVEAPIDVILDRLASRTARDSRLDHMNESERRSTLIRGAALLEEAMTAELSVMNGQKAPALRKLRSDDPAMLGAAIEELVAELRWRAR